MKCRTLAGALSVAFALFTLLTATVAHPADLHVDARNAGKENGSASGPYRTIGAAVNTARAGDRIKVAAGTYSENLHIRKGLTIEGGFSGATADGYAQGSEGDFLQSDPSNHETVVRGNSRAPVIFADGTIETTIDGLVITGGKQGIEAAGYPESRARLVVRRCRIENNGDPKTNGGGIRAKAELLVEDSVVRGNTGDRGSGIAAGPARAVISRTIIEDNTSHGDHGGGIYAAGVIDVVGCVVRNNTAGKTAGYGWGGGMIFFNLGTKATVVDTDVRGNYAPTKGSGVFVDDGAEAALRNVLIADNRCAKEGGALYVDGDTEGHGSKVSLVNVTIAGHNCDDNGYGQAVVMERGSSLDVVSSIFWNGSGVETSGDGGNTLTVRYSNVRTKQGAFPGVGNISSDPLFVDPKTGDYRLKSAHGRWSGSQSGAQTDCVKDSVSSPSIDTGDPEGSFEREPEPNGGRVDMGAYGNSPLAGCGPQDSLRDAVRAPSLSAPSFGSMHAGVTRGRCGCDVPGAGGVSSRWLLAFSLVGLGGFVARRKRNPSR